MNLSINNREVKIEPLKSNEGTELAYNGRIAQKYSFNAFSNERNGGDESWKFYENEFNTDECLKDNRNSVCSALFYQLTAHGSWDIVGGRADQWGCILLQNYQTKDQIYIEFDSFEHGLLAAYLIAKQLNPEDFE